MTPFTHPVSDLAFVAARRSLNFATRLEIKLVRWCHPFWDEWHLILIHMCWCWLFIMFFCFFLFFVSKCKKTSIPNLDWYKLASKFSYFASCTPHFTGWSPCLSRSNLDFSVKFPSIFWFPSHIWVKPWTLHGHFVLGKTASGVKPPRSRLSAETRRNNGGGLIELSAEELLAEDEEAMGRWGFGGTFNGKIPII